MKIFLKTVLIIVLITLSTGCGQNINDKEFKLEVNEGVDIWNSINYEVIRDIDIIKEFDPSSEGSILIHYSIRIENRGNKRANSFGAKFIETIPHKYIDASENQGIGHGYLDPDEGYKLSGHYIFNNISDAEDFIENSNVEVKWIEGKENKEIILRFPSKPTY